MTTSFEDREDPSYRSPVALRKDHPLRQVNWDDHVKHVRRLEKVIKEKEAKIWFLTKYLKADDDVLDEVVELINAGITHLDDLPEDLKEMVIEYLPKEEDEERVCSECNGSYCNECLMLSR